MQIKKELFALETIQNVHKLLQKKRTTSKSVYEEILMLRLVNIKEKYKHWQEHKIQTKYA